MNPLTVIDIDTFKNLQEAVGPDILEEIVLTFCEETKKQMHEIAHALDIGDHKAFTRLIHSVKSTSLTFGALAFGEQARELELLGRNERLEDAHDKFKELLLACDPIQQQLKDLCHE